MEGALEGKGFCRRDSGLALEGYAFWVTGGGGQRVHKWRCVSSLEEVFR
jgi:hypothetical protein